MKFYGDVADSNLISDNASVLQSHEGENTSLVRVTERVQTI